MPSWRRPSRGPAHGIAVWPIKAQPVWHTSLPRPAPGTGYKRARRSGLTLTCPRPFCLVCRSSSGSFHCFLHLVFFTSICLTSGTHRCRNLPSTPPSPHPLPHVSQGRRGRSQAPGGAPEWWLFPCSSGILWWWCGVRGANQRCRRRWWRWPHARSSLR
jgi:hypothetical protein